MDKIVHCLFEQSGTFKNEFKKLGFKAFDYDILNDFGETDFKIDLFNEIDKAYKGEKSLFDCFSHRTLRGDNFKKPTQYWFINCEPKFNIILEPITIVKYKTVNSCWDKVERSMINPQYANRFIREFIL